MRGVLLYRAGLVTAAASFLVAASGAFLPEGNAVGDAVRRGADLFYAAGAGDGAVPTWAWALWSVVIGSAILVSVLWGGNLWFAYFRHRMGSSKKEQ